MKAIFIIIFLLSGYAASAQFFSPIHKPKLENEKNEKLELPVPALSVNMWRPVINVPSYAFVLNKLLTGTGIEYEHLTFDVPANKWNVVWGIAGFFWYDTPLDGTTNTRPVSYGIAVNYKGLILVGVSYDGLHLGPTLGFQVSLNN